MLIDSLLGNGAFDPETASLLASAFESAWETVKKSGSPLAADGQALSTREILAKRIIDSAQFGERDPKRLINDLSYGRGKFVCRRCKMHGYTFDRSGNGWIVQQNRNRLLASVREGV